MIRWFSWRHGNGRKTTQKNNCKKNLFIFFTKNDTRYINTCRGDSSCVVNLGPDSIGNKEYFIIIAIVITVSLWGEFYGQRWFSVKYTQIQLSGALMFSLLCLPHEHCIMDQNWVWLKLAFQAVRFGEKIVTSGDRFVVNFLWWIIELL